MDGPGRLKMSENPISDPRMMMQQRSQSQQQQQQHFQQQNQSMNTENQIIIDYRTTQNSYLGARFIFECGLKLDATPITIATSANMFHRFFKEVDMKKYDVYLIGATSLYLAGKVENQHLRIRDVINVAFATLHRNKPLLDLGPTYFAFRDGVFQAELLMMRILSFKIALDHPHKFLTHYLKSIEDWVGRDASYKQPVARTAWAILQDFHHDSAVVEYPPEAVAVAAIQLSMQIYGATVPLCSAEGKNSWQVIVYPDLQPDIQNEIMLKMLRVYEMDAELIPTVAFKQETVNGK